MALTSLKVFPNGVVAVHLVELGPWTMIVLVTASKQTKEVPLGFVEVCTKGGPWVLEV